MALNRSSSATGRETHPEATNSPRVLGRSLGGVGTLCSAAAGVGVVSLEVSSALTQARYPENADRVARASPLSGPIALDQRLTDLARAPFPHPTSAFSHHFC